MQKSLCITVLKRASHGCFREREIVVPDENKLCM